MLNTSIKLPILQDMRNEIGNIALAALLSLCGCASLPSVTEWDSAAVLSKSSVKRDEFKRVSIIQSPCVLLRGTSFDLAYTGLNYHFLFQAQRKDGEEVNYWLVFNTGRTYAEGWAFWKEAYDKDGKSFKFSRNQDVGYGGSTFENCSAWLSRTYLESIKQSGTTWKIYGDRAECTFEITPNWVQGFLAKCDEQFSIKTAEQQDHAQAPR